MADSKEILSRRFANIKRFASIQDFLGSKIFPLLLEVSGIGAGKMSDVLEHDYPEELSDAMNDLKYCVDSCGKLEGYYSRAFRKNAGWHRIGRTDYLRGLGGFPIR
jgi:hypothetical protein